MAGGQTMNIERPNLKALCRCFGAVFKFESRNGEFGKAERRRSGTGFTKDGAAHGVPCRAGKWNGYLLALPLGRLAIRPRQWAQEFVQILGGRVVGPAEVGV